MRLIFMGTPAFAVPTLRALQAAGHEIVAVYTQPPRPAGRGKKMQISPVHQAADDMGLTVYTPTRLRDADPVYTAFKAFGADAAIVVAYGNVLPNAFLQAPRLGCINVHASLLPRWRGAAPIQAAICAGDTHTGITIMQMDHGLDTGPILATSPVQVAQDETGASLHDKLAPIGASLLLDVLRKPRDPAAQPFEGSTYAPKLTRESGLMDWSLPARTLERRIRAFTPWPSCMTFFDGVALRIGGARVIASHSKAPPGQLLDDALTVQCGQDALQVTHIQRPGKTMLDAAAFLRGVLLKQGMRFG